MGGKTDIDKNIEMVTAHLSLNWCSVILEFSYTVHTVHYSQTASRRGGGGGGGEGGGGNVLHKNVYSPK